MKKGVAVCDGYAELFKALAGEAGLNVRKITGKAKGIYFYKITYKRDYLTYFKVNSQTSHFTSARQAQVIRRGTI